MHIGSGLNTVSSLYGHQKGDHMKTIELSHKKHKANENVPIYLKCLKLLSITTNGTRNFSSSEW